MGRAEVEAALRSAFAGVTLGGGTSLRQAAALDAADEEVDPADATFRALREGEVVDDWTRIPAAELARDNIAHLDAAGLRYYLPALLIWLLEQYDDAAARAADEHLGMTVIGTLAALAPSDLFADELYEVYDGFTDAQRAAIAAYAVALPGLVRLDPDDAERLATAVDEYWSQFLPSPAAG